MSGLRWLVAAVVLLALATSPAAPPPAASPVREETVYEVAAQLRCVVCQNLSVADSPSEMAGQMRAIVRERLAAGESPSQVRQYFVDRYGDWILLSPPRRGFNLLVWILPFVVAVAGVTAAVLLAWRWSHRRRGGGPTPPDVDAAMRERIRREVADL